MSVYNKITSFDALSVSIRDIHEALQQQASKAVNICLTLRNWAIGFHIREYEQNGSDRAGYGDKLLQKLSLELQKSLDKCYSDRYLRLCRQFYETYPQIWKPVISKLDGFKNRKSTISILQERIESCSCHDKDIAQSKTSISARKLVENLSFTKFTQLIKIDDPLKRAFYEFECIRGNWSVRELKRQIASLYYERSALSKDKQRLSELANATADQNEPALAIRDPYVFEFLGIKPSEVMVELRLEEALTDKLQDFLLELGHGFCFEARQKRILIGDTYGFVDLVFYHRILKCHVLIDLKLEEFSHDNIGQLNTYVSWYRRNMMAEDDNPPVGILLCTNKDHALVEYALAGMDNQLFVSKYQLALPDKEAMERFLEHEIAASELDADDSKTGRLVREIRKRYGITERGR